MELQEVKREIVLETPADEEDADGEEQPLRCLCHRLICIRYGDIIEIKCAKCKRMIRIETEGIVRATVT